MSDPRLEDHAFGIELQITELVERRERASVQGRTDRAKAISKEIEALQAELANTAEEIADEHYEGPQFDAER